MNVEILIRVGTPNDYIAVAELMYDAIHHGPTQYTRDQSRAWAPAPRSGPDWENRWDAQHVIVAERADEILGFMSIEPGGYIDFAYIRPSAQGSGLFRQLFNAVLAKAQADGETELSTHASLMAQPAFAAMGFGIDFHETVEINGHSLARARMTKTL